MHNGSERIKKTNSSTPNSSTSGNSTNTRSEQQRKILEVLIRFRQHTEAAVRQAKEFIDECEREEALLDAPSAPKFRGNP